MVGAMSILSDGEATWLGNTPITAQEVSVHEVIWPEGRPHKLAEQLKDEQPSLSPHVRTARIVRVDRRQFRVYDGGRKDDPRP